jgi:WD40 repeat protein
MTEPMRLAAPLPSSRVADMAHDAVGSRLATAHTGDTIRVWKTGPVAGGGWSLVAAIQSAHAPGALAAIRWAPRTLSPSTIATVGSDGVLALYVVPVIPDDAGSRPVPAQTLRVADALGGLSALCISDEGVIVTTGEEKIARVYRSDDGGRRWLLVGSVELGECAGAGVAFRPGSSRVFCAGGVVVARGKAEWEYDVFSDLEVLAASAVDWGRDGFVAVGRSDGGVEIWHMSPVSNGDKRVAILDEASADGEGGAVVRVAWDVSGGALASAHANGVVRIWGRAPELGSNGRGSWPWTRRDLVDPQQQHQASDDTLQYATL